jgi:hypothetical protein
MEQSGKVYGFSVIFDGNIPSLMSQVQNACGGPLTYRIVDNRYIVIKYKCADSVMLMKIMSALILCGIRHIDMCAGDIKIYLDETEALILHWN